MEDRREGGSLTVQPRKKGEGSALAWTVVDVRNLRSLREGGSQGYGDRERMREKLIQILHCRCHPRSSLLLRFSLFSASAHCYAVIIIFPQALSWLWFSPLPHILSLLKLNNAVAMIETAKGFIVVVVLTPFKLPSTSSSFSHPSVSASSSSWSLLCYRIGEDDDEGHRRRRNHLSCTVISLSC